MIGDPAALQARMMHPPHPRGEFDAPLEPARRLGWVERVHTHRPEREGEREK